MLKVKKLDPRAIAPTVVNPGEDLAFDLYALENVTLSPGEPTLVRTGIAAVYEKYDRYNSVQFSQYGLLIRDRSSMAKKGIMTSGGVIDSGYRGEIMVVMTNLNLRVVRAAAYGIANVFGSMTDLYLTQPLYEIKAGDKIAQMIPIPVLTGEVREVQELPPAKRGDAGFGSTGR